MCSSDLSVVLPVDFPVDLASLRKKSKFPLVSCYNILLKQQGNTPTLESLLRKIQATQAQLKQHREKGARLQQEEQTRRTLLQNTVELMLFTAPTAPAVASSVSAASADLIPLHTEPRRSPVSSSPEDLLHAEDLRLLPPHWQFTWSLGAVQGFLDEYVQLLRSSVSLHILWLSLLSADPTLSAPRVTLSLQEAKGAAHSEEEIGRAHV